MRSSGGFTLTELLVVVGVIAVLAFVSFANFFGAKSSHDVTDTAQRIASLLREAQSRSVSQSSGARWGVHFENSSSSFYALFSSAYSSATVSGYYPLPPTVAYDSSTIPVGSPLEITFKQISGTASVSASIRIYLASNPSLSSTISVASSGVVSY